jgi:hypothetical protein
LLALTSEVRERGCAAQWLDMLESEYGFLMAMARSIVEQRKIAEMRQP